MSNILSSDTTCGFACFSVFLTHWGHTPRQFPTLQWQPSCPEQLHSSGHSTASATAVGWARTQPAWHRNRHCGITHTNRHWGVTHTNRHWEVTDTMPLSPPSARSRLGQLSHQQECWRSETIKVKHHVPSPSSVFFITHFQRCYLEHVSPMQRFTDVCKHSYFKEHYSYALCWWDIN